MLNESEEDIKTKSELVNDLGAVLLRYRKRLKTGQVADTIIGYMTILCGIKAKQKGLFPYIEHDLCLIIKEHLEKVDDYFLREEFNKMWEEE